MEWVARLCRAVRETLDAERVIAWLYDAPAQTVTPIATDAPGVPSLLERLAGTPIDSLPFACIVLLESRGIDIANAQDDERVPAELAAELGMGSVRFEPLLAGRPVGMVSIEPSSAAARTELQSLLPLLAAGAGRLAGRRESDRARREAEFLLELTEAASAADSLDRMLAVICEQIAAEVGARRASIYLMDDGKLTARAMRSGDGSYDESAWTRVRAEGPPPLGEAAVQSGRAVVAEQVPSPLVPEAYARALDIGSALAVPLGAGGRTVGVLLLDDAAPGSFSHGELRLAETAGRHVGGSIAQALVSDERTSHLRAATAIRRLLQEGVNATSVREAGEVAARVTRDVLGAERATLMLQNDEDQIELVVSVGADGEFDRILKEHLGRAPAAEFDVWRLTTRQPKPIFVENSRASRLLPPELVDKLGIKSYVAVPLFSANRPLGLVLCSHSSAPRSWSPEERQLVGQIALEGSLLVENAVLRSAEQETLSRLMHQAFHDSLTKLPNRALFSDRLQHAIDRMMRRQGSIAVLFLDLDEFKHVNDTWGHLAGSRTLREVGQLIATAIPPGAVAARYGGDEFVVILPGADAATAEVVAEALRKVIADTAYLTQAGEIGPGPAGLHVTASVGVASYHEHVGPFGSLDRRQNALLRLADAAMYDSKAHGKNRLTVATAED
jgi:diguanylate cyclase (GGDEF)-like protein